MYVEAGDLERALEGRLESAVNMRRWSDHLAPVYTAVRDRGQLPAALAALAAAPGDVARTDGFFFYEYALLGELDAALAALDRLQGGTDTTMTLWLPSWPHCGARRDSRRSWRGSGSRTIGGQTACRTSASRGPAKSSAAETVLPYQRIPIVWLMKIVAVAFNGSVTPRAGK